MNSSLVKDVKIQIHLYAWFLILTAACVFGQSGDEPSSQASSCLPYTLWINWQAGYINNQTTEDTILLNGNIPPNNTWSLNSTTSTFNFTPQFTFYINPVVIDPGWPVFLARFCSHPGSFLFQYGTTFTSTKTISDHQFGKNITTFSIASSNKDYDNNYFFNSTFFPWKNTGFFVSINYLTTAIGNGWLETTAKSNSSVSFPYNNNTLWNSIVLTGGIQTYLGKNAYLSAHYSYGSPQRTRLETISSSNSRTNYNNYTQTGTSHVVNLQYNYIIKLPAKEGENPVFIMLSLNGTLNLSSIKENEIQTNNFLQPKQRFNNTLSDQNINGQIALDCYPTTWLDIGAGFQLTSDSTFEHDSSLDQDDYSSFMGYSPFISIGVEYIPLRIRLTLLGSLTYGPEINGFSKNNTTEHQGQETIWNCQANLEMRF